MADPYASYDFIRAYQGYRYWHKEPVIIPNKGGRGLKIGSGKHHIVAPSGRIIEHDFIGRGPITEDVFELWIDLGCPRSEPFGFPFWNMLRLSDVKAVMEEYGLPSGALDQLLVMWNLVRRT